MDCSDLQRSGNQAVPSNSSRPNEMMKINKSTRHAKITGDFGEAVVLYWLSKYGFECAPVDHTGIDIIARNLHTNEVMGIAGDTIRAFIVPMKRLLDLFPKGKRGTGWKMSDHYLR